MIRLGRLASFSGAGTGVALLVLILSTATALEFVRLPDASDRLNRIPAFGAGFITRDVSLSQGDRAVFGKAHVLRREIISTDESAFRAVLTVIDGTEDRHAVHDPDYCIRGAGWAEDTPSKHSGQLSRRADINVTQLHRGKERREIIYFFSNGKERYSSPMRYWRETTFRRITLGATGPEPVLVLLEVNPETAGGRRMDDIFPILEPMLEAL